jgi:hypothetical protein
MEETTTISRATVMPVQAEGATDTAAEEEEVAEPAENGKADADGAEKGGRFGWMKGGKNVAKKKPGKLPPRQAEQSSKDSREAAADILREMTRRR